jgi:hypothetical protein
MEVGDTMLILVDTETRESLAQFKRMDHARSAAICISRDFHLPLSLMKGDSEEPIARYSDGREIERTAGLHEL